MLRVYRAVVEESISAHKGHIFSSAGDGVVAEFPSISRPLAAPSSASSSAILRSGGSKHCTGQIGYRRYWTA